MKLDMRVGIGPDHIVLEGDPDPLPEKDTAPNFGPISVVAKWPRSGLEDNKTENKLLYGWLRGPAVEHRSLAGVLSLSCVPLVADG